MVILIKTEYTEYEVVIRDNGECIVDRIFTNRRYTKEFLNYRLAMIYVQECILLDNDMEDSYEH